MQRTLHLDDAAFARLFIRRAGVRVLLTFDDGPGPSTPGLLDALARHDVRAVFFLLGRNIERFRSTAIDIAASGHLLGNHGFSHVRPQDTDPVTLRAELERTDALLGEIAAAAGVPMTRAPPVRLPYGPADPAEDDPRIRVLSELGRPHVGWTADFADWLDPKPDELLQRIREHLQAQRDTGGVAVLDLHDSSKLGVRRDATVEAVRRLLEDR